MFSTKLIGAVAMRVFIFAFCALAVALSPRAAFSAPAQAGFSVGSWAIDTVSRDGRFDHCFAVSKFDHGVDLAFLLGRDNKLVVTFRSYRFNFRPGERLLWRLALDGSEAQRVHPTTVAPNVSYFDIPHSDSVARLPQARLMRLYTDTYSYDFQLRDMRRMIPQLLKCVRDNVGPAPFRPTPLQAEGQPKALAISQPTRAAGLDLLGEVTSLAANLLSQAGVKGFRIATPKPGDSKTTVTWNAPGMNGALLVLLDPAVKRPADATPKLVAISAEKCKGKFISGAMPEENGAARVFSSCQIGTAEPRMSYYLTMPRAAGGHYVLATFPLPTAGAQSAAPQEHDKDIRNAAYQVLR